MLDTTVYASQQDPMLLKYVDNSTNLMCNLIEESNVICRVRKIVFVHIPKCGGTSIENYIWSPDLDRTEEMLWMGFVRPHYNKYQTGGLQHLTARQIHQEVGEEFFSECYSFAICRHPLNRIISQYRSMSHRPDLREFAGLKPTHTFDHYLDRIFSREHVQWMPQVRFVCDENGKTMLSQIIKLENLEHDFSELSLRLNLPVSAIPHANKARGPDMPALSLEQKDRIVDFYREDYEFFGYPL